MLQPSFTVTPELTTETYTRFVIEPLEKGYGHTLGVSLRRVLLSSIEGSSVTNIRISGVQHQFTTLDGMKEDVVELILNIKQLNFALSGDDEEVKVKLEAQGPGVVTGKDIGLPANVTLANPELILAELADAKNKLNIEITIGRGRGYSFAADRISGTLGDIPVDASFSPIVKVAYKVESTRVGRRTDYDKLILDLWTDGTVDPREVVDRAAKILVAHFKQVFDPIAVDVPQEETLEDRIENEVLKLTVEELDLPTRIANALRKGGYKTVKDLTEASRDEVAKVKNLGEKSVDSVGDALVKKGLSFKQS